MEEIIVPAFIKTKVSNPNNIHLTYTSLFLLEDVTCTQQIPDSPEEVKTLTIDYFLMYATLDYAIYKSPSRKRLREINATTFDFRGDKYGDMGFYYFLEDWLRKKELPIPYYNFERVCP